MVWKSTTKVAFGIKGKWVIAWYCDIAGNNPPAPTDAAAFKDNVGSNCLIFLTRPPQALSYYNECYNTNQIAKHNQYRRIQGAPELVFD